MKYCDSEIWHCDETQIHMKYYFWQFLGLFIVVICDAERTFNFPFNWNIEIVKFQHFNQTQNDIYANF